jgi:hypothetical protein
VVKEMQVHRQSRRHTLITAVVEVVPDRLETTLLVMVAQDQSVLLQDHQ